MTKFNIFLSPFNIATNKLLKAKKGRLKDNNKIWFVKSLFPNNIIEISSLNVIKIRDDITEKKSIIKNEVEIISFILNTVFSDINLITPLLIPPVENAPEKLSKFWICEKIAIPDGPVVDAINLFNDKLVNIPNDVAIRDNFDVATISLFKIKDNLDLIFFNTKKVSFESYIR